MKAYKVVRVLRNNNRVSSFIDPLLFKLREGWHPGYTVNGESVFAKMLHYGAGLSTAAPDGSPGIYCYPTLQEALNEANYSRKRPVKKYEIWQVDAKGKLPTQYTFETITLMKKVHEWGGR